MKIAQVVLRTSDNWLGIWVTAKYPAVYQFDFSLKVTLLCWDRWKVGTFLRHLLIGKLS